MTATGCGFESQGTRQMDGSGVRDAIKPPRRSDPAPRTELVRTIEAEIIPRLVMAHRAIDPVPPAPVAGPIMITDLEVAAFAELIVRQSLAVARSYLDGLMAEGLTPEAVIVDVLSPTARHLGLLWEQDRCTFVDVTVGLSRLQQLLRVYGPAFEAAPEPRAGMGRLLLAVMPGEQHTFGLAVVEGFFRRAGWHVNSTFLPSLAFLKEQARTEWFDIVGLSASGEVAAAGVTSAVAAVRAAALNPNVKIILGGQMFAADPGLALSMGADFGVRSAQEAVVIADGLVAARKTSC